MKLRFVERWWNNPHTAQGSSSPTRWTWGRRPLPAASAAAWKRIRELKSRPGWEGIWRKCRPLASSRTFKRRSPIIRARVGFWSSNIISSQYLALHLYLSSFLLDFFLFICSGGFYLIHILIYRKEDELHFRWFNRETGVNISLFLNPNRDISTQYDEKQNDQLVIRIGTDSFQSWRKTTSKVEK